MKKPLPINKDPSAESKSSLKDFRWEKIIETLKETSQIWRAHNGAQLAAALSFYTLFSLAPMLVIIVVIAGSALGPQAVRGEIVGQLRFLGPENATFVQEIIKNAYDPGSETIATILSAVVLLYTSSILFRNLQVAVNSIWDISLEKRSGLLYEIRNRAIAALMVIALGIVVLVVLVFSSTLSLIISSLRNLIPEFLIPGTLPLYQTLSQVLSFLLITFIFIVLYRFVPNVDLKWRDVFVGAVGASILFNLSKYLFDIYLSFATINTTYGTAGSLVVLLIFVYYAAQILLLGVAFTKAYTRYFGSRISLSTASE